MLIMLMLSCVHVDTTLTHGLRNITADNIYMSFNIKPHSINVM